MTHHSTTYEYDGLILNGIEETPFLKLKNQGVQGIVMKCVWNNEPAILKISNHVDFMIELEQEAWLNLQTLNSPHFCNVFEKKPIKSGRNSFCLFLKELTLDKQNITLTDFIIKRIDNPNIIINCIRQTLAGIVMFEKIGITHYDLHTDNVMLTSTPYDIHVYKFDDIIIPIRTDLITPVIIDFGMAYIRNNRYNATCVFSDNGFTTFMQDPIIDSQLLLITSIKNLKENINKIKYMKQKIISEKFTTLEKFIRKIELLFLPLNLDKESGWYKKALFTNIVRTLKQDIPLSFFRIKKGVFKKDNFDWIIELLQHLITLPLEPKVMSDDASTVIFARATLELTINWKKFVEPIIRNTLEEQMFFKDLVMMPFDADIQTLTKIKRRYPKIVNIKQMRNLIQTMGDAFNNLLYEKMIETKKIKDLMYSKLIYSNTLDILRYLPHSPIVYTKGMKLLIMTDSKHSKHSKEIIIDQNLADSLNKDELTTFKIMLNKENNEET